MPQFDVTLAGEANLDMVFYGLPIDLPLERELLASDLALTLGGSSAITAHNLASLGSRVGFISQASNDAFTDLCFRELRDAGVDVSRAVAPRDGLGTGVTVILQHSDVRRAFTYSGAIAGLRFADLDLDYLTSARHFHLASYFLQESLRPDAPKLLAAMQNAGVTTSLDTNDDPEDLWDGTLQEVLRFVDILLPNEREACRISGENDVERAAQKLAAKVPTVVLKRGAKGALAIHNGKRFECASMRVSVVDAVGAGDSFNAGFLHAFTHGADIEQCLQMGNLCGVLSTTAPGGTKAFRDKQHRERFFAANGAGLAATLSVS